MLSIASRMMEDGRDEALNRYDSLVRIFDLDPPEGFSDMADFNAELNASLDRLHPKSREFIDQSLRGGTQTPGHLFPAGLPLVTRLKERIDEAVARYIAELDEDARASLSVAARPGLPLCRVLVVPASRQRLSRQPLSIPTAGSAPVITSPCPKR